MIDFTDQQIQRYARHILLKEVGCEGQAKLMAARVLVIGAGGLGSPLLLYLAAAGVGKIGIVDHDRVDLSNLQRQIVHNTKGVGLLKVESAAETLAAINPDVTVVPYAERITATNAESLIADYDFVADGSDNFATRFLVNDACHFGAKTLVSAAILRFDAQIATFKSHLPGDNPCYRCLYREPPPPGDVPTCSEAGVMGALCGMVGSFQATEIIKEILAIGDSLAGRLIIYEGLSVAFRKVTVHRDSDCPLCGDKPTIKDLTIHGG